MKQKTLIHCYYILILMVSLGIAASTVFIGSRYVVDGAKMAELEQQKHDLVIKQQQLDQKLAQELTLSKLTAQADQEGYTFIQQPIQISTTQVVALR